MKTAFAYFFDKIDEIENSVNFAYSETCKRLDKELLEKIIDMRLKGKCKTQIAKELRISSPTVYYYLNPEYRKYNREYNRDRQYFRRHQILILLDAWTKEEIERHIGFTEDELRERGVREIDKRFLELGMITVEKKNGKTIYRPNSESPYRIVMGGLWKD